MAFGYQDFFAALRQRESSGNYKLVNSYGYLGAYQFGEGALVDLGFVNNDGKWWDNDFSGGWTGSHGIDSKAEFLSTPTAQDTAAAAWFPLLWTYLTDLNADDWLGKTIAGIEISASGLIAGAHLLGAGSVVDWLESGGKLALSDAYGTPISEYIGKFSGYSLPFVSETTKAQFLSSAIASFSDGIQNQIQTILDANGKFKIGSDGVNDRLSGASGHDVLAGGSGNDTLVGRGQRDALIGGDGSDLIKAGSGNDLALGGEGRDVVRGAAGSDSVFGGGGNDILRGGKGNDRLYGGNDNDRIYGGGGSDIVNGGNGRDVLIGLGGKDLLYGGSGNDYLNGGKGKDIMHGGGGADVFVFADKFGNDRILDFDVTSGDRVRLSGVASITDFADLMAHHVHSKGADLVIKTGTGQTLVLEDIAPGDLSADDFIF